MSELSNILPQNSVQFLETYINNPSPTGFEFKGQEMWLNYIKPYIDDYEVDNYGTVYGVIHPKNKKNADFKVLIEAHADEISWFVHHISEDGFIYVVRNGGSDHQIAPSKRVNIHTKNGYVKGIFGWTAIHLRHGEDEVKPKLENIFIDTGCSTKQEVEELGVQIGNVITYEDPFIELNNKFFVGRALDNRIGGFMIAQVARLLKENKIELPYTLYIVNSVQEEVGLRGAQMITQTIKPNVALITDVGHDTTTPNINKQKHGEYKVGKGPILSFAPAVHNKFLQMLFEVADEAKIPYQREALYYSTGTDTDAFAFSNGGVVSGLVSLPLRYMHTTVETVSKSDVEDVIKLMYYTLQKIEYKHNFKYFN